VYRLQRIVRDPTGRVQLGHESYGDLIYTLELSCNFCGNKINNETVGAIQSAMRAEKAGRYEDAARDYERVGFFDKAKAPRGRGKTTIVRHQYVDINNLLEQIRQGDLVVLYRCPDCRAGVTINKDTSIDRLTNCPYCGSALVVSDIEKFLSSIL
jgi:DNA-directed RNA polymerase subunit RPC12/RpoP